MDKSVAQALNGLIPTLTGPLPPELLELAVSLLAQSRSKASSLKVDEEIARSYACANLACERLKQTLALPKIQPRPPCPPRVYQKLYRFLDAALPTGTRRSNRSSRERRPASTSTNSPAKPKSPIWRTPVRSTTSRRKTLNRSQTLLEIPEWVMPTIRQLCERLEAPQAPPHVFAGVCSILTLPPPREATTDASTASPPRKIKVPALIIAVFLVVTTRLAGVETRANEYLRLKAEALALLENSNPKHDWGQVDDADINDCMREIKDKGWTELDWFANIPVGGGFVTADADDNKGEASPDEDETYKTLMAPMEYTNNIRGSNNDYLQAGLGTMMRDNVDYLSEKRRSDYQKWKIGILVRIEELQNANQVDVTMD